MATVTPHDLDSILALQLTVAWAGEKAAEPERLGWWNTDLTDEMAGGDLFSRLLPRTAVWAALELTREAALRADRSAREKLAHPDDVWSLYHFGFELDETLQDRLEYHKRHASSPASVFGERWPVGAEWKKDEFEQFLHALGDASPEETPAGRKLALSPEPERAARTLAAALLPLSRQYPLPYGEIPKK